MTNPFANTEVEATEVETKEKRIVNKLPQKILDTRNHILPLIPREIAIKAALVKLSGNNAMKFILNGDTDNAKDIINAVYFGDTLTTKTKLGEELNFSVEANKELIEEIYEGLPEEAKATVAEEKEKKPSMSLVQAAVALIQCGQPKDIIFSQLMFTPKQIAIVEKRLAGGDISDEVEEVSTEQADDSTDYTA
jgi:hypothetical protein